MALFDDPKGFLKNNLLRVTGGEMTPPNSGLTDLVPGSMVYMVNPASAIGQVKVEADSGTQNAKFVKNGGTAAYVLPWSMNCGIGMQLKKPDGVQNEPTFFITAQLNGCLVCIDGELDEPYVWHFNAKNTGGSIGDFKLPADGPRMLQAINTKTDDMVNRFKIARGTLSAQLKKAGKPGLKSNGGRYIGPKDYLGPAIDANEYVRLSEAIKTQKGLSGADIKSRDGKRVQLSPTSVGFICYGTVVGVKTRGSWSFYLQHLVQAAYNVKKASTTGTKVEDYELRTEWLPGESGRKEICPDKKTGTDV